MKGHLLISEFQAMPWAMMPERLNAASAMLGRWVSGARHAMEDDDFGPQKTAWEVRRERAQAMAPNTSIAVLPVYGTIVQRANMMTEWCGGTSTQQLAQAFREAMADSTVGAILLDIDSPGGSVYGVGELAAEITAARGQKPIIGLANSLAASAGYWLLSACEEVYVTPGGEVGSIGVWQAHFDYSAQLAADGVKPTLVSAGKFKVEGNPYNPLDEEAQAYMQQRVDDYYQAFSSGVAKARGVSLKAVQEGMGQGRCLGAEAALAENMVDGIATFEDVVRKMQKDMRSNKQTASASRLAAAQRDLVLLG